MDPIIEEVIWRDAHSADDDPGDDWAEDYLVHTVGFTSNQGRWLRIEQEHTPDGPRAITWVPLENIVRRHRLGRST